MLQLKLCMVGSNYDREELRLRSWQSIIIVMMNGTAPNTCSKQAWPKPCFSQDSQEYCIVLNRGVVRHDVEAEGNLKAT